MASIIERLTEGVVNRDMRAEGHEQSCFFHRSTHRQGTARCCTRSLAVGTVVGPYGPSRSLLTFGSAPTPLWFSCEAPAAAPAATAADEAAVEAGSAFGASTVSARALFCLYLV